MGVSFLRVMVSCGLSVKDRTSLVQLFCQNVQIVAELFSADL